MLLREKDIMEEIKELEKEIELISKEHEGLEIKIPEGARLRAVKHGNVYQYFVRGHGSGENGIYIKKKDRMTAQILAQVEYDKKLKRRLQNSLSILNELITCWKDDPFNYTADQMIDGKRKLVDVPYLSDKQFIYNWINEAYDSIGFREGFPEYYTRQGLRVRSKSEVIIADILDEFSIPFRYEKPLLLNKETVHPDFTLLNIRKRKEVYWEHFGMMDDIDYRNNALFKIRRYEDQGYYQMDSFVCTFESGSYPINTKDIRKMIKNFRKILGYE